MRNYDPTDPLEAARMNDIQIPERLPFIVPDFLRDTATILMGRPEAGKSFIALSIADAVQDGKTWLGREAEQRDVLFLGLDPGQTFDNKRRMLKIPGRANFWLSQQRPINSDDGWDHVIDYINRKRFGLVIIDNLHRIMPPGGSVRNDEDVQPVLDRLDRIIDNDAAVLLLHHTGKPGIEGNARTTPMGATCIEAWARHFIVAERPDKRSRKSKLTVWGNDTAEFETPLLHVPDGRGEDAAFFSVLKDADPAEREKRDAARDAKRLTDGEKVARHYLGSGEVFNGRGSLARWLTDDPPKGFENKSEGAWKQYIRRTLFQSGYLAGGDGAPIVAGPNLDGYDSSPGRVMTRSDLTEAA